mgnify:CR=1 FL=1
MDEMQERNFFISLNKLRNYNNRINERKINEQRNKKVILYNKEVKKIMKKAEKRYIDIINKKDEEIKSLKNKLYKGE